MGNLIGPPMFQENDLVMVISNNGAWHHNIKLGTVCKITDVDPDYDQRDVDKRRRRSIVTYYCESIHSDEYGAGWVAGEDLELLRG